MACVDFLQHWDNIDLFYEDYRHRRRCSISKRNVSCHRDNIDCRHMDHLTLHKVKAMELAKNVKRQNSQFGLCVVLASVQCDTDSNSGIDTHTGRMIKKQQQTITLPWKNDQHAK